MDFFIMLPSCVPATHLETAGARITADDLKLMIGDERIAGGGVDEFPGVFLGTKSELAKIEAGKGKCIDGRARLARQESQRLRAGRRSFRP